MTLPNAARAVVAPEKILRYLLDPANPRSRGKPQVFFDLGYRREQWEQLQDDLRVHARTHEIVNREQRGAVTVYSVDGDLIGPNGRTRRIRSVWQVDDATAYPRLITAFPAPSGGKRT